MLGAPPRPRASASRSYSAAMTAIPIRPRPLALALVAVVTASALDASRVPAQSAPGAPARPFGTQREQAEQQQRWLKRRMETVLPALMRKHKVDLWVIPMREYND